MNSDRDLAVQEPQQDEEIPQGGGDVVSVGLKNVHGDMVFLNISNAMEFFSKPHGLEPILERIRIDAMALAEQHDISHPDGRKAIASAAYRVSRSKTAVEKIKKRLTADQKAQLAKIDSEGRRFSDECDKIRDNIRRPLTEWEDADRLRIQTHERHLKEIEDLLVFYGEPNVKDIEDRLTKLSEDYGDDGEVFGWEEFAARARKTIAGVTESLGTRLAELKHREAQIAEALRLRAVEEEERRLAREEQLKNEAAARARAEVEARSKAEADALAAKVKEDADRAERARQELEQKTRQLEHEAQLAEQKAQQAEEAAKTARAEIVKKMAALEALHVREKAAAEEKARKADEMAKAAQEAAVERERKRAADEQARIKQEADQRREQKRHRDKVHSDAAKEIMDIWADITLGKDISDHDALAVVQAISENRIPHIQITY